MGTRKEISKKKQNIKKKIRNTHYQNVHTLLIISKSTTARMSLFNPPVRYYIFGVSVSPGYPQPVNATAVIILLSVGCPSFCRGPGAWCNSQTGCFCANGYYSALSGCNVTGNPLQYLACHSFTPPPIEFFEGSVHEFGRLAILLMLLRYLRPFLQYA